MPGSTARPLILLRRPWDGVVLAGTTGDGQKGGLSVYLNNRLLTEFSKKMIALLNFNIVIVHIL